MARTACALLTGLLVSTARAADPPPTRVLVLPAETDADADDELAAFTDRVVVALDRERGIAPITPDDLDALLRAERFSDLLGCTETSCLTELAGAAGADRVLWTRLVRTRHGLSCFFALHDVVGAEAVRRRGLHGLVDLDAATAREVAAWVGGAPPRPVHRPIVSVAILGPITAGHERALTGAVETALAGLDSIRLAGREPRATHAIEIDVTTLEVVSRRHHIRRYLDAALVATLRATERSRGTVLFTRQVRVTASARARTSTPERVVAELCEVAARQWAAALRADATFQPWSEP